MNLTSPLKVLLDSLDHEVTSWIAGNSLIVSIGTTECIYGLRHISCCMEACWIDGYKLRGKDLDDISIFHSMYVDRRYGKSIDTDHLSVMFYVVGS